MQWVLFNPYIGPYQVLPFRGQSGPGNNGNEGVFHIPQSSSITGTSPSDCLVSYPGDSLGRVLPLCRGTVSVFYRPSQLGNFWLEWLDIDVNFSSLSTYLMAYKRVSKVGDRSRGWPKGSLFNSYYIEV